MESEKLALITRYLNNRYETRLTQPKRAAQPSNEIQSTKYYVRIYQRIMQNKPNFQKSQMNLSILSKMDYENFIPLVDHKNKPNQTQFKPNTKPIPEMPKMSLNTYLIRFYSNKTAFRRIQNKPKQTHFQTQFFNSFIRAPYTLRCPAPGTPAGFPRLSNLQGRFAFGQVKANRNVPALRIPGLAFQLQ